MTVPAPAHTFAPEPNRVETRAAVALAMAVLSCTAAAAVAAYSVALMLNYTDEKWFDGRESVVLLGCLVVTVLPAISALLLARRAEERIIDSRGVLTGTAVVQRARIWGQIGVALGIVACMTFGAFLMRDGLYRFKETFLSWPDMKAAWPNVWRGFKFNIKTFIVAEAIVLVWALVVALVRLSPGPALAPLRWLAVAYTDIFRGLPALLTIYLVVFGIPIAGFPFFGDLDRFWLGVIALSLVYGAYVSEVYRSGIEGVHWSQSAAARSLGLSHLRTQRYVVVPQAIRNVIPPLLNDFIGLQKDTALLYVAGIFEGFTAARIYAGTHFNVSSVTLLGLLFVAITIPQARMLDWLIARDKRKRQAQV